MHKLLSACLRVLVFLPPGVVVTLSAQSLASHSALQVNLGPVPFDKYTSVNFDSNYSIGYVASCSTSITVRQCYQTLFSSLSSQGAEGVRFFIYFCGGGWSSALQNCGSYNSASLNSAWAANVALFFQDLASAGLFQITPTIPWWGAADDHVAYCNPPTNPDGTTNYTCGEYTGNYNFLQNSLEPSLNDGIQYQQIYDSCTGTTIPVFLWPSAPFVVRVISSNPSQNPAGPWMNDYNNSYNCSPQNPIFAGWQHIYDVINSVLGSAYSAGLNIHELDMHNEINLTDFTVTLRTIYDNKHGDTGTVDVVDAVNYYMAQYGFDQTRTNYSTAETQVTTALFE